MKMTQLNLTEPELLALKSMMESYLSDLRMEIADTGEKDFRENLKQEEVILNKILMSLKQ